jgi:uncharacterized membrane protein YhaH (DUF805 family)
MISLLSGRIGRVRYIALRSAVLLVFGLVFIGLSLLTGLLPVGWRLFMGVLIVLAALAALALYALPAVRRAHDFNTSGWLALLSLVPLVSLVFWFIPGTPGANRFGDPMPPNTRKDVGLAWLMSILALILIVFLLFIVGVAQYRMRMESTDRSPPAESTGAPEQPGQEP